MDPIDSVSVKMYTLPTSRSRAHSRHRFQSNTNKLISESYELCVPCVLLLLFLSFL